MREWSDIADIDLLQWSRIRIIHSGVYYDYDDYTMVVSWLYYSEFSLFSAFGAFGRLIV
jgi:hypothetical protein